MQEFPPTSANYRIVVAKNSYFNEAFQFDDPTNVMWDLNSKSFRMDIKGDYEDDVPLITFDSAGGEIVVDYPVLRIIHFVVPDTDLRAALKCGTYFYDLIMTDNMGVKTQLLHGEFVFADAVTGD
jgi:hypothetical protein